MRRGPRVERMVGAFNARMIDVMRSPRWSRLLGRKFVVITYVGRRSGRTFSTPVEYKRAGDEIVIGVMMPDAKNWWRNFLDGGGPMSLHLDGVDRAGHARAQRDERGRVHVKVHLDPA